MQSISQVMVSLFQGEFETYMDEMCYDYIFEQMMPAVLPMVVSAHNLNDKEIDAEMEKNLHEEALDLCKLILNDLVKDQTRRNYS
jgi:hypothetical protein